MKCLYGTSQLIRDEHKKIRGLFRQLDVLEERAPEMVGSVLEETCSEIQIYLELEERLLFSLVHRVLKEKYRLETPESEFIHQGLADHREIVEAIRRILGPLRDGPLPYASDWNERIEDLVSVTEAYLISEEKKLLPFVERNLPSIDAMLSMKWFDLTEEIRARLHVTCPSDPAHAQNPGGGEQRRKTAS